MIANVVKDSRKVLVLVLQITGEHCFCSKVMNTRDDMEKHKF